MLETRRSLALWGTAVLAPIVVVVLGSVVQPEVFYDRFFWQYLYGPIQADAQTGTITRNGVTASPGYTVVSSGVYAYYLLLAVIGTVRILDVLEVAEEMRFFYALVPYGFLGGALRVVEDTGSFGEPLAYLFISPVIYITMFLFTLAVFIASVVAERRGIISDYSVPVAGAGAVGVIATVGYLLSVGGLSGSLALWVPLAVVGAATTLGAVIWLSLDRLAPWINRGTGFGGGILLWAHLLDGFSTVVGVEYLGYGEKQPTVDNIISITGTAYSFVGVKAGIVVLILYAFDERFFEEFNRLPYILLIAVLAVGLGPGTRNTLRMTLGI